LKLKLAEVRAHSCPAHAVHARRAPDARYRRHVIPR
jgi:hypothetical protein